MDARLRMALIEILENQKTMMETLALAADNQLDEQEKSATTVTTLNSRIQSTVNVINQIGWHGSGERY